MNISKELLFLYQDFYRLTTIEQKVKFIGKVVDSSLEEVKSQETPFIWEIHNATGFKNMGVPISTLAKMQKIPVNHYISVATDELVTAPPITSELWGEKKATPSLRYSAIV